MQLLNGGIYSANINSKLKFVVLCGTKDGKLEAEILKSFEKDFYGKNNSAYKSSGKIVEIEMEDLIESQDHSAIIIDLLTPNEIRMLTIEL